MNLFNLFNKASIEKYSSKDFAFVYSYKINLTLDDHIFPGNKYKRIYELICLDESFSEIEFFEPEPASLDELKLVHTDEYLDDIFSYRITERTRYSELPLNPHIIECFTYGVGGTILATDKTKEFQFVYFIGGGFHHSFRDHAEGFCYFNDVAIATEIYLKKNPDHKILIIDLDVHQGNGNSHYFENRNQIYTFSMHQENLYPKKQNSNLDISLADNTKDAEYLELLESSLLKIESEFKPNLVYYLAGADPFENDSLGSIKLSLKGLANRDILVKKYLTRNHLNTVILTAGGYAKNFNDTVAIHIQTAKIFASENNDIRR
jgi:acetoin utilization deacetylase AcuC-like enzyme